MEHWGQFIQSEEKEPYFKELAAFLREEYAKGPVYPPKQEVFSAFRHTDLPDIKAVILGQDPYYHAGEACGMCFAVAPGVRIPPSLRNIYQELHDDLGLPIPDTGYLGPWADRGVMLLNTVLTVRDNEPMSHRGKGWETFTDRAIQEIDRREGPVVFLLWGAPARKKAALIHNPAHLVLEAAHPSPLSAYNGFFGCRHFSKANEFLKASGAGAIDWRIENVQQS